MLDVQLSDEGSGESLESVEIGGKRVLVVADHQHAIGVFITAARTTAGTTVVVTPPGGGSIALHDLIISSEKQASGTITLHFTDDAQTEVIIKGHVTDAPLNLTIPLKGRWRGWKDARLELVAAGATFDVNVSVGYALLPSSLDYTVWDAQRRTPQIL